MARPTGHYGNAKQKLKHLCSMNSFKKDNTRPKLFHILVMAVNYFSITARINKNMKKVVHFTDCRPHFVPLVAAVCIKIWFWVRWMCFPGTIEKPFNLTDLFCITTHNPHIFTCNWKQGLYFWKGWMCSEYS